jgi:hypothetical protein
MSESGSYDPGPWRDYSFKKARTDYDSHAGRSYSSAKSSGKKAVSMVPSKLTTKSKAPLVIACDVTGSMGEWPGVIFSKLPYLDLEGKEYMGKDMKVSFAAIGDAYCDDYPLQIQPFCTGRTMEKNLKNLVIEGGGGGTSEESYDLAAVYYANCVVMPNAVKPVFIYIGDEGLYNDVDKQDAKKWAHTSLEKRISSKQALQDLQTKFSVYLIRKPYGNSGSNTRSSADLRIHDQWADYIGADHISMLPKPDRVVDVIFGILAKEKDRVDYFKQEITERQTEKQVKEALEALHPIIGGKK